MAVALARLRRITRDELAHRLRVATRVRRQRIQVAVRPPSWDRRALRAALAPGLVSPELSESIDRGDWAAANAALMTLFNARSSRFVLDPQSSSSLRRAVVSRWPGAVADAAARGNALLDGRYDVLGYDALSFARKGRATDWHFDPVHRRSAPQRFWADVPYLDPRLGDHKIIWELNRQQHLLPLTRAWWLTGDVRYRDGIAAQIQSWMAANPPLVGINWASMLELAFRSLSWLWGLHALLGDHPAPHPLDGSAWLVDLLVGLDRQLAHVEQNLSRYFSPNTHLTGEALALYVAGAALPELARSARWLDTGREVLLAEIPRQIGRDGGHAERSTHYHRYTLDFYLLALLAAERIGDSDTATVFGETAIRLAAFMQALVDERGRMPQIGDDDGGMLWPIAGRDPRDVRDSLGLAAVLLDRPDFAPWGIPEEAFWVGWSARRDRLADSPPIVEDRVNLARHVETTDFRDTGFLTIRNGRGDHLVLDAGPHGYLNSGHAHADALSVTLAIDGAPLLIDPGTATYTMDPVLRDRMRSTAVHNTLTLDGRSSSRSAGPFHWRSRADAQLDASRHNAGFAWAESHHDGYGRARHRRSIVHSGVGGWLLVDEVAATTPCAMQLHWQFDPAWRVSCERDGLLIATDDAGRHVWLLHEAGDVWLAYGDDDSGLGWCSPRYGLQRPTCAARIARSGAGPMSMVTWLDAGHPLDPAPVLQRVEVDADRDAAAVAVAVRRGDHAAITLLRPGDRPERDTRSCTCGDYHTDARLLQCTVRDTTPVSMSLADASHALALRDGCLSVAADEPVSDLHLFIRGDQLEAWATTPPSRLHLHGGELASVRSMRLNGRELRVAAPVQDGVTLLSADWKDLAAPEDSPCVESPASSI